MNGGIKSTNRVNNAIRKADALRRDVTSTPAGNSSPPSTGGNPYKYRTKFAKITVVTDANNYEGIVYKNSDLSDASPLTGQVIYVMSLSQELAVDSIIPVQASDITDVDYECNQQLGLLTENP